MANEVEFSICIPNFNYKKYLALTCKSVLEQDYSNYEIVIADNQSTDGSIEFIKTIAAENPSIRYVINPSNFGFSGNLEKVTSKANGKNFILLSSDDLMNAGALTSYRKLMNHIEGDKWVIGSSVNKVDSDGKIFERCLPEFPLWKPEDIDQELSAKMGQKVYVIKANEMLRRCLTSMGNPYYFLTVCYPATLFHQVGGYGGGRMYNPDKWFNWKLFSEAETLYLIDEPLFSYRWHQQNQLALETSFGHLKYLVDDYRNTIEATDKMLSVSGLTRHQLENVFVKRDIYRHGIGEFTKGRWVKSLRIFFFGLSAFPGKMIKNKLFIPNIILLLTTPLGAAVCALVLRRK